METPYPGVSAIIRQAYLKQSLAPETIDVLISSLAESSLKQYNCAYKKWWQFCLQNKEDCFSVNIPFLLKFLTVQYNSEASYSTLNTIRSALALILGKQVSEDERISRFLKGVFRTKPCQPRYQSTWDPNEVLNFLGSWYPNHDLSIEKITKKLVTLLALSTAQRVQTLSLIRLSNIRTNANSVEIIITDCVKTSAPGRPLPKLTIPFFTDKNQICPAKALTSYIEMTQEFRDLPHTDKLFLTYKRPIHNATSATISRWIKSVLSESGIDITIFSAHSTRHASTSAANRKGLSVDIIKRTAGWSGNSLVFAKFYNRPVIADEDSAFAEAIYNN